MSHRTWLIEISEIHLQDLKYHGYELKCCGSVSSEDSCPIRDPIHNGNRTTLNTKSISLTFTLVDACIPALATTITLVHITTAIFDSVDLEVVNTLRISIGSWDDAYLADHMNGTSEVSV